MCVQLDLRLVDYSDPEDTGVATVSFVAKDVPAQIEAELVLRVSVSSPMSEHPAVVEIALQELGTFLASLQSEVDRQLSESSSQ